MAERATDPLTRLERLTAAERDNAWWYLSEVAKAAAVYRETELRLAAGRSADEGPRSVEEKTALLEDGLRDLEALDEALAALRAALGETE